MPYKINIDRNRGIVEIIYNDVISVDEVQSSVNEFKEIRSDKNIKYLLTDCSEVETNSDILDYYLLVHKHIRNTARYDFIQALILPQSKIAREKAKFYELVCQNNFLKVKSFQNKNDAEEWFLTFSSENKI